MARSLASSCSCFSRHLSGQSDFKRRIETLRRLSIESGRAADAVEIGGLAMIRLSHSKSEIDAAVRQTASAMGFPGEEAVRNSPVLLIGTPAEVKRELRSRIEEFGMTYFITFPASAESRELLVKEVMPEFSSPASVGWRKEQG
jgi:alkanesulfonate monooxygenase SsuD/methylene tetrahydromethanopterin reductase-like flavin-dependent oxidoreductase (luciferase family)